MMEKIENEKVKKFREITEEMVDLYAKKNENYGDSFGETWRKLGPISGATRMNDKMNRICQLVTKNSTSYFESLEDNLIDIACYAIMGLIELRGGASEDEKK